MVERKYVDSVNYEWSVFVKIEDEDYSERDVRIYVKPIVPFSVWPLYEEGYSDIEGNNDLV